MSLPGATLVTGGARRLGRTVCEALAGAGAGPIVIHANSSRAEGEALAEALSAKGVRAVCVTADLSDPAAIDGLVDAATAAAGEPLTGLVNCAAIFEHDVIENFSRDLFEKHMRINAYAAVRLSQRFAHALPAPARGAVTNFLDFKLAAPYPDHLSYTLSKYALMGATEMLARALAPRIRVNAVAPGYVLPAPGQPQADFERLHAQTPLGVGAPAHEVGQAVLYLMRQTSVTGQTIYLDAGLRFRSHDRDFAFL